VPPSPRTTRSRRIPVPPSHRPIQFKSIPYEERARLFRAMKLYASFAEIGYVVKNYGSGLHMIKRSDGQGRCLFFLSHEEEGVQTLVALLAYKKETQKLPERLRRLALERMKSYKENRT